MYYGETSPRRAIPNPLFFGPKLWYFVVFYFVLQKSHRVFFAYMEPESSRTLWSKARRNGSLSCTTSCPDFTQHVCVTSRCFAFSLVHSLSLSSSPSPPFPLPCSPSSETPFFSASPVGSSLVTSPGVDDSNVGAACPAPAPLPEGVSGFRHSNTLPTSSTGGSCCSSCIRSRPKTKRDVRPRRDEEGPKAEKVRASGDQTAMMREYLPPPSPGQAALLHVDERASTSLQHGPSAPTSCLSTNASGDPISASSVLCTIIIGTPKFLTAAKTRLRALRQPLPSLASPDKAVSPPPPPPALPPQPMFTGPSENPSRRRRRSVVLHIVHLSSNATSPALGTTDHQSVANSTPMVILKNTTLPPSCSSSRRKSF